jgi:hypothetical protein
MISAKVFGFLLTTSVQVFEIFLETWGVSAGAKWLEHELDHSPPPTVKVKNK